MKRRAKRIIAVILTLALFVGGIYQGPRSVSAAEDYEKMVSWEFAGNDTYNSNWTKGGYTSSGITPAYTIGNGYLQVDADYTSATSTTYNRSMAVYSFGSSSQADLSESARVTFDYYCTEGNTPSQFMLVFTGKLEGASSNTTITESGKFADVAVKQSTSEIDGYEKYSVTLELTAGDENANINQREYITRFQVGEIRTNNTFNGTVYYDNLTFWKEVSSEETEVVGAVSLSSDLAVYNKEISATTENIEGTISYQWYKAGTVDLSDAVAIDDATESTYTPAMKYVGGYLYCQVSDDTTTYQSNIVRIVAAEELVETVIPFSTTAVSNNQWFLTNTKAYSGKFDADKLLKGGYFLVNYSGEISGVPSFQFATWSSTTGKSTKQITATETGTNSDGTKWAKYSYADCISAWGDEDFSELKALRVYYSADDNANLVVNSASWFGAPLSYGELGEAVALKGSYSSHQYLFTWHVGGTFDATRIREDSLFYVEYKGDADAVKLVMQSHSNNESTYVTIGAFETGETGKGYYSIFTAKDMITAFGEDLRYVDGIRIIKGDGKSLTENASMYFFEGEGVLVDDISVDGYTDAITVPWTKYDDTDKAGIAVIGASITQNPLVTASALSDAPYYAPNGGWNAILDRTDVVTYGIGSQTTVNIANRFDEVLRYDYHTIIIQCGNNDLGASSDESVVIAQEVNSYTTMFEKVKVENQQRALEGKEPIMVYVLALNPTNSEGYSNTMQSRIENVVAAIDELSSNYEFVTYIDEIHEEFKNKDEDGNYITGSPSDPDCTEVHVNPDLVMSDGLHPVAEGYAVYAKYLIPLLASNDESDSSLVSLSYRFSAEEMKKTVTGFESAVQTGENDYTVLLPMGTAKDASIQLYMTAANLSSTVGVEGYEIKTDSYGNDYIELQLVEGALTVAVKVNSPDGTESIYNVEFAIDTNTVVYESTESKEITVSDSNVDSWPYTQFTVNYSGTLYTGSTLEFDVTLDNADFTKMYVEADFDWANVKSLNLTRDDFTDNTYHAVITYAGADLSSIGSIQIKTGGSDITDYRGTITISNVKLDNNVPEDSGEEDNTDKELTETVIYTGEASTEDAWTIAVTVQTSNGSGDFDPSAISEDGYFTVEYTGEEGAIYLALAEWTDSIWASVYPVSTVATENGYISTFSYASVLAAYGSEDFSGVDAISVGSRNTTGTTVINKISWFGYPTESDLGETAMLFKGSATASAADSCLTFFYTEHVGGEWDASVINEGSYFYVEYTGAEDGVYIALTSASGATSWVAVYPDETGINADGRYYAIFDYDNFSEKFGTNFARLDQIQVYSKTDSEVTLKRVAYFAGEGDPVDASDGTWDRPTEGIAFIGDSIVQNPLVNSSELNNIDWNGILNREDCVNYGIGGQTTKECAARIDELAKKDYSKVVMLCGINDIGRGYTNEEITANYETMFAALTEANSDIEIYLISVLPTTTAYYANAQDKIVALNEALKALADEYANVTFVDCYSEFVGNDGYCQSDLVFDGLHPNLDGYAVIADVLNPYLEDETESGLVPGVIYKQKTDVVDGTYNVRFVQLITTEQAANSSSVTYTISNGAAEVERENNLCYSRIVASGSTISAPDGYVFIAYAVTGVPEGIELTCQMTLNAL